MMILKNKIGILTTAFYPHHFFLKRKRIFKDSRPQMPTAHRGGKKTDSFFLLLSSSSSSSQRPPPMMELPRRPSN